MRAKSLQSCLTLCDPRDCNLPCSSVHGILQARILGLHCHALLQGIFLTQGSNQVSCIAGGFFTIQSLGKPMLLSYSLPIYKTAFISFTISQFFILFSVLGCVILCKIYIVSWGYAMSYIICKIQIGLYLYFLHIQILSNVYEVSKHRSCATTGAQLIFMSIITLSCVIKYLCCL